ncbi:hypothetical protein BD413DRAFT_14757 [Trametes elegans]|nr:hypothetical protein BD413DRAFT_14757 [Trametes elegans]
MDGGTTPPFNTHTPYHLNCPEARAPGRKSLSSVYEQPHGQDCQGLSAFDTTKSLNAFKPGRRSSSPQYVILAVHTYGIASRLRLGGPRLSPLRLSRIGIGPLLVGNTLAAARLSNNADGRPRAGVNGSFSSSRRSRRRTACGGRTALYQLHANVEAHSHVPGIVAGTYGAARYVSPRRDPKCTYNLSGSNIACAPIPQCSARQSIRM